MLKNRHFIAYFSTTLLYVAIIGLFFYIQQQTKISTERSQEKVMQVLLSDFVPEELPVEEIPIVKEEVVEPEEIKEPVPEEIVKVVEEQITEPIVKPLLSLPKPVIEKPIIEKPKKKPEVKKIIKKKKPAKKKPVKKASRASSKKTQANPEKVNKFYKKIRVKINQNKSYPKIAKRRRMQGSVKVTFTVLRSGKVSNILINGPKVFHNSARHAVKSAFPISVKNIPVSLPATVHITLRYQIR
jgi:protein TonB